MSLRDRDHQQARAWLGQLERGEVKALQAPIFSPYGGSGSLGGQFGGHLWAPAQPGARHNYEAEAGDLWRNSAVAICLAWYADNLPEPDLRVVRTKPNGDREVVPGHPLVRLLRNPNPYYGWHALVKGLVLSYRTDGNAYLLVSKGIYHRQGDPINLWWIDHQRLRPRWDPSGNEYLGWWDYRVGGETKPLQLDQVVHLRDGIDPLNDRLGCCALKSNLREVCSDNQGATYTGSILRNMGVSGVVIQPGSERAEFGTLAEREEIADTFQKKTTGENRGKPLVTNDPWKIDQIGANPEQMALDKIMAIPESRIVAAMRLNAMVLGLSAGDATKTFSNYGESRKAAYEDGVIPFQKELAQVLTRRLMPLLGDPATEVLEFDYSRVQCLSESEDNRFKRYGTAYQTDKVITRNQALVGLNLPTVPTGNLFADGTSPEPAAGDVDGEATPVTGAVVQDQALNGAQIASMLSIAQQVATGQIPVETAEALILASFPSLSAEQVESIVGPLRSFKPAAPEPAPGKPGPPAAEADDETDKAVKALLPRLTTLLDQLGGRP